MNRRVFLGASFSALPVTLLLGQGPKPKKILLISSWQVVNIGDIAHTPGMLKLFEELLPNVQVTLWPKGINADVKKLLSTRFPKVTIADTKEAQAKALDDCDFVLHGSGPGMVAAKEIQRAKDAGKPYGFGGITLNDDELKTHRELLSKAKFIRTRDTDSLKALKATGMTGPKMDFGPDATFALDIRDEVAADAHLKKHKLEAGKFMVAVPRLRWTPYWEINPETTKPNPKRSAVNEAFAERDHAKMREAIVAWVRETKEKVLLAPEMTYAVDRLKPLLFDPLPEDIKPHVAVMDRYWLTAEAASVYARATLVLSFEMHSPIIALSGGTPAILLRQPTDTRKGQMWRDIGLTEWIFEIDTTTGKDIADRVLTVAKDRPVAKTYARKGLANAHVAMKSMMAELA